MAGDALQRLREDRQQIEELLQTFARRHGKPARARVEARRLATLIFTLLRVHERLETELLQPALAAERGAASALLHVTERRAATMALVERLETLSPHEPAFADGMEQLAQRTQAWFDVDEHEVFALAQQSTVDLVALDEQIAVRQEEMLSARVSW